MPGIAYFIRGCGESWAVIKLYPDNREEVVQSDLTLLEAEILCAMKIADILKPAPPRPVAPVAAENGKPEPRVARQLASSEAVAS